MPPRRQGRSVSRRSTPLSPPKPSQIPTTRDTRAQNKANHRSTSRELTTNTHNELQTEHVLLEAVDEEADLQQSDSLDLVPSASARSESDSSLQSDLDNLDHDEIILNLADLHAESLALLSLFDRPREDDLENFIDEISQNGSRPQKTLSMRAKKLSTSREPFGETEFISPPLIVRKLAGTIDLHRINYGRWRPDAILYLANLAQQMVAAITNYSDDRENFLSYMYNNFPSTFVGQQDFSFGTQLIDEPRDLALGIMTQFFIQRLESDGLNDFSSPQDLAQHIFQDGPTIYRQFQDEESQAQLLKRSNELKDACSTQDDALLPLDQLKEDYSWTSFVLQTAKWAIARREELKETIRRQGGVENIVDLLTSGDYEVDVTGAPAIDLDEDPEIDDADEPSSTGEPGLPPNDSPVPIQDERPSAALSPSFFAAEIRQYREEQAKHDLEISRLESQHYGSPSGQARLEIQESPLAPDEEEEYRPLEGDGEDDYRPLQGDDDDPVEPSSNNVVDSDPEVNNNEDIPEPTQSTNFVMETLKRQAIEREKENWTENAPLPRKRTLLDRQPGAERMQWQSQGANDIPKRQPLGRLVDAPEETSDDEDDFEEDHRLAKRPRIEKGKQPIRQNAQEARSNADFAPTTGIHNDYDLVDHIEEEEEDDHTRNHAMDRAWNNRSVLTSMESRSSYSRPGATSSSQPVPRSYQPPRTTTSRQFPPQSTAPVITRRSPPRSQYQDDRQRARRNMQERKEVLQKRKPQIRRPWTAAEEDRLREMVAEYQTQYALIKEMDAVHEEGSKLHRRDQVALKDKARNMKITYLKNCEPLPIGFECVSVGPAQLKPLVDLGIVSAEGSRFTGAVSDDGEE
ncbi:hypothetical protein LTR84_007448 [Exophiala bonariae]|uniref:Myb-like domain-containing protein n=1 Tax=Exophiala bonariae TaxID=1690606 RepID=A0AAV9MYW8_9EURO|nr:hypothetical protein LTR84_007448 [Exophiala bonariae]